MFKTRLEVRYCLLDSPTEALRNRELSIRDSTIQTSTRRSMTRWSLTICSVLEPLMIWRSTSNNNRWTTRDSTTIETRSLIIVRSAMRPANLKATSSRSLMKAMLRKVITIIRRECLVRTGYAERRWWIRLRAVVKLLLRWKVPHKISHL